MMRICACVGGGWQVESASLNCCMCGESCFFFGRDFFFFGKCEVAVSRSTFAVEWPVDGRVGAG